MWIADMDYVHRLYAQCLKMTGIMMMNICAVVKSSWSFVWLQELGIFTLILESKTWLGEGGSGWCHELSGAELSPGFQCVTLTFGCVCRDVLAAYSCQGTNVPVCKLIQTPPHLSGASQRAEVPEGFRCTRYWVFLVLCGFRGVLHLLQAQQGWYKAVTLLSLQEGHFRGCWEQYWSSSVSLTCLVHVMRF